MSTETPSGGASPADEQTELREQIEETSEQVGDTVEALAEKADVKTHVKCKIDEKKQAALERIRDAQAKLQGARVQAKKNPKPVAAGVVAVLPLVLVLRRRRS